MKRIIPILAALCLVVAMAVPALAACNVTMLYNGVKLPEIDSFTSSLSSQFPYMLIEHNVGSDYDYYTLSLYQYKSYGSHYVGSTELYLFGRSYGDVPALVFRFGYIGDDEFLNWTQLDYTTWNISVTPGSSSVIWSNFDLYYWPGEDGGSIYSSASEPVPLDCTAVDSDGDGYCDNCGGFFTPPPPGPLVEVLTDLKEQNQLSQVLSQVVMMIPIGLGCWAGYKGLRKALDLLRRTLHQV